jgi:hypothetical protein
MQTVQEIFDKAEADVFDLVIDTAEKSYSAKVVSSKIGVTPSWLSRYLDKHAQRVLTLDRDLPYWVQFRYKTKGVFRI